MGHTAKFACEISTCYRIGTGEKKTKGKWIQSNVQIGHHRTYEESIETKQKLALLETERFLASDPEHFEFLGETVQVKNIIFIFKNSNKFCL